MNAVVAEASDSRLLKAVESIAISPADAKTLVAQYRRQILSRDPTRGQHEVAGLVADKIISRYCRMSATTGGATALTGVIPGIGTALAMVGGGLADASISMKLQVDMTMCLAEAYGWDVNGEDARHLAFLIAAGGSLEKLGVEASTRMGLPWAAIFQLDRTGAQALHWVTTMVEWKPTRAKQVPTPTITPYPYIPAKAGATGTAG